MRFSPVNRRILALAIPSIVANITTPLLGLVDTAIVGHMGSAVYIGAIAVGGLMFNMVYWLFGFLRGGTSGLAAQACGAADAKGTRIVLHRSLGVAFGVAALLIAFQVPLGRFLQSLVDADESTASLAMLYFRILIYGSPAVLATFSLSGWFLGMQNSKMLMWTSLTINVVNIAASLILVYALGMKIEGVALGTLIAQWTGFGVGLLMLRRLTRGTPAPRAKEVFRWKELRRFFTVNADLLMRTLCLIAVTTWFTHVGASEGPVVLAVNTILMQLFMLFSYMMDGFAYAAEALVGRYVGAADRLNLLTTVKAVLRWGVGMAAAFTAGYLLGGDLFVALLSSDADVVAASKPFTLWAAAFPIAGFAAFAWDGVFVGATLTKGLLGSMFAAMLVFFAVYLLTFPTMGNHGLWLAFVLYLATRGIVQALIFRRRSLRPDFPKI